MTTFLSFQEVCLFLKHPPPIWYVLSRHSQQLLTPSLLFLEKIVATEVEN